MYAVIEINSQQFKVEEGDVITVKRLEEGSEKSITLHEVLLFSEGDEIKIGQPHLKEVKVTAEILGHFKGKKAVSFKYLRRKNRACKKGKRQLLTRLKIKKISAK